MTFVFFSIINLDYLIHYIQYLFHRRILMIAHNIGYRAKVCARMVAYA